MRTTRREGIKKPSIVTVVHIITGLETGGAEMMLYKLLSKMDRTRFRNIVISLTGLGMLGAPLQQMGIEVHVLNVRPGIAYVMGFLRAIRLLRRIRPDVLQTWLYHADFLGSLAGKIAAVPNIVWNIRCSDMDLRHYSRMTSRILRMLTWMSSVPDVVVVNSEAGRLLHETVGYTPRRWELIPNGFDTNRFQPDSHARERLLQELSLPQDAFIIGSVARFDPMKDHRNLLKALQILLRTWPNIYCVMVGKGVAYSNTSLVSTIAELGVEGRVHLLGERKDIESIMGALDVFVLPSAFGEGFPNVVGEAMSCAVPCVVTDVGDSLLVVGDTGKVVSPRDANSLAAALGEVVRMDDSERKMLGGAARRRVEQNYSLAQIVARYENLYDGLMQHRYSVVS